jgi:hypothetical protein
LYLVKYNSSGVAQWAKGVSTSGSDSVQKIVINSSGDVYVCGFYTAGGASFGNNVTLPGTNGNAAFLVKYNSSGVPQWGVPINGSSDDRALGMVINRLGHIYLTGYYRSTSPITILDINSSNTRVNSLNVLPASGSVNSMFFVKYAQ